MKGCPKNTVFPCRITEAYIGRLKYIACFCYNSKCVAPFRKNKLHEHF